MPVVPSAVAAAGPVRAESAAGHRRRGLRRSRDGRRPGVRQRTRQAVGYVTALIQGLTWPALAGVHRSWRSARTSPRRSWPASSAVGLLLRARLFITIGQRLPLLIAGIGSIAAVLVALMTQFDGPMMHAGGRRSRAAGGDRLPDARHPPAPGVDPR